LGKISALEAMRWIETLHEQSGYKKSRLGMVYLKISVFQNSTSMAETCNLEPLQPHTIYRHSQQNDLLFLQK
jgi:hypothetical protein